MAQQGGGAGAGSGALGNQFGDTTFTKVFVGGLAWETQRDTMRRHFEQFGDILEAVVITDKNTGRSKGYGFGIPQGMFECNGTPRMVKHVTLNLSISVEPLGVAMTLDYGTAVQVLMQLLARDLAKMLHSL